MAPLLSFAAWRSLTNGQTIGSGECVALVNDYCSRVLGLVPPATVGGAHDPYASSMWEGLPADSPFKKVSPLAPMLSGDIPVWRYGSAVAPLSHTAVGVQDLGVAIRVVTQNTNGHRYAETTQLPKAGLYGYLRRKSGGAVPGGAVPAGNKTEYPDGLAGDLLEGAGGIIGGGGIPGALSGLTGSWGKILDRISDPAFWQRIGLGLLGIILIMVVLVKILGNTSAVTSAAGIVKKAL